MLFQYLRAKPPEYPTKRVMRWDTIRKLQKRSKPVNFRFGNRFYLDKSIRTTDGTTDRKNKNIDKQVLFIPLEPKIFNIAEILNEGCFWLVHGAEAPVAENCPIFYHTTGHHQKC